jgi:hypothetical protein
MATERPRVYVTLDQDIYENALKEAKVKRISISLLLRDKIREAMQWRETFEILGDKEAMKTIKESLAEIQAGEKGRPWRELFK